MKTIYKYELKITDKQEIALPKWCTPLSVQIQNDTLQMWVLVNPEETNTRIAQVRIFGTGHSVPDNIFPAYTFLGTVQQEFCVWHVFIVGSFTSQL